MAFVSLLDLVRLSVSTYAVPARFRLVPSIHPAATDPGALRLHLENPQPHFPHHNTSGDLKADIDIAHHSSNNTLITMAIRVLALCGFTQNSHIYSKQVGLAISICIA